MVRHMSLRHLNGFALLGGLFLLNGILNSLTKLTRGFRQRWRVGRSAKYGEELGNGLGFLWRVRREKKRRGLEWLRKRDEK